MWLGVIIGLGLGAAFESFKAAVILATVGGIVGAILKNGAGRGGASNEVQAQIRDLQERLSEAVQRIYQLEQRLKAGGVAAVPPTAPAQVCASLPTAGEAIHEDELTRQALAAESIEDEVVTPPVRQSDEVPETLVPVMAQAAEPEQPVVATEAEVAEPVPLRSWQQARANAAQRTVEVPVAAEPTWISEFIARWVMGGNPIVKVGVLILFLGLAFLLRYVTENTEVPISLRYAGVAAAGIGLLLFGWRWRNRSDSYGLILQGAGIGVLYLTTLAGMKLHPLIPPEFGFVVLIVVAAFAVLLALLQDSLALAAVAALGGFAAPVLASTGSANHLFFFAYLTVINLGIVAIAWFKAWRPLNVIGFVCSIFLAAAWGDKYYQPALFNIAEPFLILLFVLYVLVAFLFARRTLADAESDESVGSALTQVNYVDASLVFGVPMSTFGLQYMLVRSLENGAAFSALAFGLVYIVLGFALFRNTGKRYALLSETMVALAVIFGSLAIPLGLEGEWTSAAWAVEAAGVYWVGVRQNRLQGRLFALLLMFGAAVYFALDVRSGSGIQALDGSWMGCLLLILSTAWTYRLMRTAPAACLRDYEEGMRPWLIAASSFFVALMPFLLLPLDSASAALAVIGLLSLVVARRLEESILMVLGCFYQLVGGVVYRNHHMFVDASTLLDVPAFQYQGFWIQVLIAISGFISARLLARRDDESSAVPGMLALLWSAAWWAQAWVMECGRLIDEPGQVALALLAVTVATALVWRLLARRLDWRQLGQATVAYLPVLALLLFVQLYGLSDQPLAGWGALLWPLALVMHVLLLRDQKDWLNERMHQGAHVVGTWLFLFIAMLEIHWHFAGWGDPEGAWPMLGWLVAPLAFLWSLSSSKLAEKWPLSEYREVYAVGAALPVVVFLLGWTWLSNLLGEGAAPLPYLPVLNPIEMGQIGVLLGVALWWRSLGEHPLVLNRMPLLAVVLGVTGLTVISSMVLRACHQWGGVPWETHALLSSLLAQSALSIVWSSLAISLMLFGNRSASRWVWLAGAALVAVVVLKLFTVELAAKGSLERIVSFIAVGMLLLLVGYFAPLPPKRGVEAESAAEEGSAS